MVKYLISLVCCLYSGILSAQPKMQFDSTSYDYGIIESGFVLVKEFRFTNIGNAPLIISHVQTDGGCMAEWPKDPISHGSHGVIKITYNRQGVGKFERTATVSCNDPKQPYILRIKGKVMRHKTQ